MTVWGAVLAAGRGRRVGTPKALLEAGGRTFVEIGVEALRAGGCAEVVVVVPPGLDEAVPAGIRRTVNPDEESGPIGSLAAALAAGAAGAEAVVAWLVDVPGAPPAVVRALVGAPAPAGALFVVPRYDDGRGHPVLVRRAAYPLVRPGVAGGLRALMRAHAPRVAEVRVAGPRPRDIDTPEDYEAFRRERESG